MISFFYYYGIKFIKFGLIVIGYYYAGYYSEFYYFSGYWVNCIIYSYKAIPFDNNSAIFFPYFPVINKKALPNVEIQAKLTAIAFNL